MLIDIKPFYATSKTFPDSNGIKFDSYENYIDLARQLIYLHVSEVNQELAIDLLNNEDIVSDMASTIIMADWQFNGRGTKWGYRKQCVKWAVYGIFKRLRNKPPLVSLESISLDDNILDGDKELKSIIDNKCDSPDKKVINDEVYMMLKHPSLSKDEESFLFLYYIKDMTMKEIAGENKVSDSWVSKALQSGRNKLRRIYNKKE